MDKDGPISAVLADVDGTLVTRDKVLTERARRAVQQRPRERGIAFTITSGRPPFGMRMLVEPLGLTLPMAAFNGGAIVLTDLSVLDERLLPSGLAAGPDRPDPGARPRCVPVLDARLVRALARRAARAPRDVDPPAAPDRRGELRGGD